MLHELKAVACLEIRSALGAFREKHILLRGMQELLILNLLLIEFPNRTD